MGLEKISAQIAGHGLSGVAVRAANKLFGTKWRIPVFWGNLRRLEPFERDFGFKRGEPISRYYIRQFIESNLPLIGGRVLEFGTPYFGRQASVRQLDILDVDAENPEATIIGDVHDLSSLDQGAYDCVICTNVLEHVADPAEACRQMHGLLAPSGVVLITVPHIDQVHPMPHDYWRFTEESLRLVLRPYSDVNISTYGNACSSISFLMGLPARDLPRRYLSHSDPRNPVLYGAVARL